jgi:hypothetical protein
MLLFRERLRIGLPSLALVMPPAVQPQHPASTYAASKSILSLAFPLATVRARLCFPLIGGDNEPTAT